MKVKTEHILIGAGAGIALFFGYNYMQKMNQDRQRQQNLEQQKQNLLAMQQNIQNQNTTTTGTGSAVENTVKDARSIIDLFAESGLLTNDEKQACITRGGTWDGNGLFKKGFCVEAGMETATATATETQEVAATRGTEPYERTVSGFAGLNAKGELI